MNKGLLHFRTWYELAFAILVSVSLVIQFVYGMLVSHSISLDYIVLFISYFTIVSNVLVTIVLYKGAFNGLRGISASDRFDRLRGTAVFCIVTTGIIYSLFLKGPGGEGAVQDSIPIINAVFHYMMPAAMALDWILFPTEKPTQWISILRWIGFTLLYLVYVEILGFFTNTYPYFFVDPTKLHGYLGLLRASLGFVPFFVVFGFFIVLVNRLSLKVHSRAIVRTDTITQGE